MLLSGTGVSYGIGVAKALIWHLPMSSDYIPRTSSAPQEECEKFKTALQNILNNIETARVKTALKLGSNEADIFAAYKAMLEDDEALISPIIDNIMNNNCSAEHAAHVQFSSIALQLSKVENEYICQRAEDIIDLRDLLLRELQGISELKAPHFNEPTIVVAHTLSPTDLTNLDVSRLEGIICEAGGQTSHMAILARTLNIPAIVGAQNILSSVKNGQLVALDGYTGESWISPTETEINMLQKRAESHLEKTRTSQFFKGRPTVTQDGRRIELSAKISSLDEIEDAIQNDAESIGMLSTEFLFKNFNLEITEEHQFNVYCDLLHKMNGKAATIRTYNECITPQNENNPIRLINSNPAMGHRGIRASLAHPSIFRTQLRALLRASAYGNLRVLFPMVSGVGEITGALNALESVKKELAKENVPFDENLPVGVVIAIPSAALMADAIAEKVNFLSIDINDLIQFTLAVDPQNKSLFYLQDQHHPAVLKLIALTIAAAHRHGISCNICGESSSHALNLPLMLGLAADSFTVNPKYILPTRGSLNNCNFASCEELAISALRLSTTFEVTTLLNKFISGTKQ